MTYKAPSYITDTHYGYRVKSLFILLAKTAAELNAAPSKVSDLRSIIYHLEKTKDNIFDVQNEESQHLAKTISCHLDANIRAAEEKIKEIDLAYEKTRSQKNFLLFQLNEHGVPWHDQSLLIGNFGASSVFMDDDFVIDNAKVATSVYKDLCEQLPADHFKIKLLTDRSEFHGAGEPVFSAVVTFSSVYADQVKQALKKLAEEKLLRASRDFGASEDEDQGIETLSSEFHYDIYALSATGHLKPVFSELIGSQTPDKALDSLKFHHELVFLNLEEYYDSSDLLSEYVTMISQENQIVDPQLSKKAEANCMDAYYAAHKEDVNIGRLMQALEREMEASRSLQQISK